jgi:hypothetical protein
MVVSVPRGILYVTAWAAMVKILEKMKEEGEEMEKERMRREKEMEEPEGGKKQDFE